MSPTIIKSYLDGLPKPKFIYFGLKTVRYHAETSSSEFQINVIGQLAAAASIRFHGDISKSNRVKLTTKIGWFTPIIFLVMFIGISYLYASASEVKSNGVLMDNTITMKIGVIAIFFAFFGLFILAFVVLPYRLSQKWIKDLLDLKEI